MIFCCEALANIVVKKYCAKKKDYVKKIAKILQEMQGIKRSKISKISNISKKNGGSDWT